MPNFRKQNPMGLPQSDRVVYVQGPEGPAGLTGKEGPEGPDGAQGVPGPRGWSGLQGPPGEPGPQGAPGQDGADGAQGSPGLSAFDIALIHGFVGTEAQWLASLVGPKGDTGATGPQGIPGPQGLPGTNGTNGVDGQDGADGVGVPMPLGNNGQVLSIVNGATAWADSAGGGTWGSITGTLSNQTDLQNALDAKLSATPSEVAFSNGGLIDNTTDGTLLIKGATDTASGGIKMLASNGASGSFEVTNNFAGVTKNGEAYSRTILQHADGKIGFGPGTATRDTWLYRDSAGVLKTDGKFTATGRIDGPNIVDLWDATKTYANGDSCIYGGVLWLSNTGSNLDNEPGVDAGWGAKCPIAFTAPTAAGQKFVAQYAGLSAGLWDFDHPISKRVRIIEEDFLTMSTNTLNGLTNVTLSSGLMAVVAGDANHPGVVAIRDSTTANGGGTIRTDTTPILIAGGETSEFIFQSRGARSTAGFRMGFEDSFAFQTQPTDAVCFEVANQSTQAIRGMCKNNAGPTYTGTTYTLTINTWYKGRITVNQAATSVLFEILSEAGAVLWSQSVAANIPKAAGRQLGFGIVAGETTTDAGADIMYLDYMSLDINRTLTR